MIFIFRKFNGYLISKKIDIVDVGFGIDEKYNDYKNIDVKNKIVLIREGIPLGF